jgi:hypothetical protein
MTGSLPRQGTLDIPDAAMPMGGMPMMMGMGAPAPGGGGDGAAETEAEPEEEQIEFDVKLEACVHPSSFPIPIRLYGTAGNLNVTKCVHWPHRSGLTRRRKSPSSRRSEPLHL